MRKHKEIARFFSPLNLSIGCLLACVCLYSGFQDPFLLASVGGISVIAGSLWYIGTSIPTIEKLFGIKNRLKFWHVASAALALAVVVNAATPAHAIFLTGLETFVTTLVTDAAAQSGGEGIDPAIIGLVFNLFRLAFLLLVVAASLFAYNQAQQGNDCSGIVRQIKASLFLGDRVVVSCDGLEFSKDLYEALQTLFPEKRIVCINSENSNELGMRSLIENINAPGKLDGIDCLIYSPSVNTGVSIDVPHFDKVFGVFVGGSLAGTDCIQALNRYRPKVDWHVWVKPNSIGGYRPTSAERIKRNKLQENDLCGFLLKIIPGSGEKTIADEFAWNAWATIQARRNESLNNLRGDMRYLIEAQGHRLISLREETDWETKEELKAARNLNQQSRNHGICSAEKVSPSEARRLESKERPTQGDWYKLERYRIETAWGREVDAELIELDKRGRTIRQFTLLESLLEEPSEIDQVNGKRILFSPTIVATKGLSEREKYHPLDWRDDSVAWALRRELGLHLLVNPEREFRNDDPNLLELEKQAQRNALIIKDFLGTTIRRNATPIQILQQLFEQIGLRLVCDRREGARGEQVRVYRLDLNQWAVAQEVLEHRRLKRETQALSAVEMVSSLVATEGDFHRNINKSDYLACQG